MTEKQQQQQKPPRGAQPLLTKKSLALSLSAPRAPPHSSVHRQLLLGKDPSRAEWTTAFTVKEFEATEPNDTKAAKQERSPAPKTNAHSFYPHDTLRQRLVDRFRRAHADAPHRIHRHPHLPAGPELGDQITRALGLWLSHSTTNHLRDAGHFRSICDALVTASVPLMGIMDPRTTRKFIQLTKKRQKLVYGSEHKLQYMDLYLPEPKDEAQAIRMVFFLHGGAWGSGMPWMYRLCAYPFLQEGWAVAIPSYRTYPDGKALDQVQDAEQALAYLYRHFPQHMGHVTLMGHSSGAHIGLLLLAERAKQVLEQKVSLENFPRIDAFVGLSGPYDISHHFDYEAARGVEELSPMKAACGMSREGFRLCSPALRFLDSLTSVVAERHVASCLPPHMLLLHAVEDETVPFTSTAEAARVLRSCGVAQCQEYYVGPGTGHQDTVMQLMTGGPSCDAVLSWMRQIMVPHPPRSGSNTFLRPMIVQGSKL